MKIHHCYTLYRVVEWDEMSTGGDKISLLKRKKKRNCNNFNFSYCIRSFTVLPVVYYTTFRSRRFILVNSRGLLKSYFPAKRNVVCCYPVGLWKRTFKRKNLRVHAAAHVTQLFEIFSYHISPYSGPPLLSTHRHSAVTASY